MFVCWPHSSPGNVSVPCPSYLPWISEGDIFIALFSRDPIFQKHAKIFLDGCAKPDHIQLTMHKNSCIIISDKLAADGSRRAHRECLENGTWRERENSSEPWRDDSECKEEHYFKDKVSTNQIKSLLILRC